MLYGMQRNPPHIALFFCLFYYEMAFTSSQPVYILLILVLWDDYETNLHLIFAWRSEEKNNMKCQNFLVRNHPLVYYPILKCSWLPEGDSGPVPKGANHILKAVSDHDPLRDRVRDMNYVRLQALRSSSQSQTGAAHCEVIFWSYCADWPLHGFSALFQNAHELITFRKSFVFTSPQNQAL